MEEREHTVDDSLAGTRLDRALEALLPGSGLRHRRRLIESGRVLVDGHAAAAGLKLKAGQRLELSQDEAESSGLGGSPVPVVARTASYAAVDKPAGLHSAALAGGGGPSLEALLPALFPGALPVLLNRLDLLTSGLVLVAMGQAAARTFQALPPASVVKEYLAVVRGELDVPLELKRRLDADDCKRTRVLGRLDPDPRAWTLVRPEARLAQGRTLVSVRIQAGARHQIRAHLAAAGLPILGDPLYGEGGGHDCGRLYLHHQRLEFRGFRAFSAPPWLGELDRSGAPDPARSMEEA